MKNIFLTNVVVKVFFIGNFPIAPGTACSLLTALLGFLININYGSDITLLLGSFSGIVGFYFTNIYLNLNAKKDPKEVVIDEFSGQMIATSAAGVSPLLNLVAFFLFRFFDIIKPGLISKAENLDGSLGVMMDDWLAGIFTAIILLLFHVLEFTSFKWFLI